MQNDNDILSQLDNSDMDMSEGDAEEGDIVEEARQDIQEQMDDEGDITPDRTGGFYDLLGNLSDDTDQDPDYDPENDTDDDYDKPSTSKQKKRKIVVSLY